MSTEENKTRVRQRSLQLDDFSYGLLEAEAMKHGLTNAACLRMLLRRWLGGETDKTARSMPNPTTRRSGGRDIEVPNEKQETFKVPKKFRDRGGRRVQRATSGLVETDVDF